MLVYLPSVLLLISLAATTQCKAKVRPKTCSVVKNATIMIILGLEFTVRDERRTNGIFLVHATQ